MTVTLVKGKNMSSTYETKLTIKSATFELDFEGREEFAEQKLVKLAEDLSNIKFNGSIINTSHASGVSNLDHSPAKEYKSTADIAAKLKVKTGPELAVAAMAKLHFVDSSDSYERKAILNEMKAAKAFYKKSHGDSLSGSLVSLQKQQRILSNGKKFSLAQDEIAQLGKKL